MKWLMVIGWIVLGVASLPVFTVLIMAPNHPRCIGYCYGSDEFKIHWQTPHREKDI